MNESVFEQYGKIYVLLAFVFLAVCSGKPLVLFLAFDCWDKALFEYKERSNLSQLPAPYPLIPKKKTSEPIKKVQKLSIPKISSGQTKSKYREIDYPWKKWVTRNKERIEKIVQSDFSFRDELSEFNMIFRKLAGMKMPLSSDETYVISGQYGHLLSAAPDPMKMTKPDAEKNLQLFTALCECSQKNGAGFLTVFHPGKDIFIPNTGRYRYLHGKKKSHLADFAWYVSHLQQKNIHVLDLYTLFDALGNKKADLFYRSDHHWNLRGGILGAKYIAAALNRYFGFEYDLKYFDANIFYKCIYDKIFIGSLGKKVNRAYMQGCKPEDFELWIPTFETDFTLEYPTLNKKYDGKYDIMYFESNFKKEESLYNKWCYSTFFDGDKPLVTIKNHLAHNRKKILFIKNSHANVVIPFLALQTKEIYMFDPRFKKAPDLFEYISKIKPDVVVYFSFPDIVSFLSTTYW